ncbi:hypothetical protein AJ80_02503 [Polytolypa hystricis UAMH7299]|uniref:NADH dehydrogenase [ubiquinone] 1 alpha subcomplex subunit n=1 Tax=Polytolypa hystricis (strain UAMH7299) TaxID=1447883 RepID=A0A2B7YQX6_POLH7|nr:hypothetical protein AJ80_02503 [Polytolypa hystricis UAMH7299]
MSTLTRTFRNLWRIGFKEYGHQMQVCFLRDRNSNSRNYSIVMNVILTRTYLGIDSTWVRNCPSTTGSLFFIVDDCLPALFCPAGDTKAGALIAIDRYGNKYYENAEELPLRTRWVDYKDAEFDASQVDAGWHAWLAYIVDKPPTEDKIMQLGVRSWEQKEHRQNPTMSRAAFRTYNTVKPKYTAWEPVAAPRVA